MKKLQHKLASDLKYLREDKTPNLNEKKTEKLEEKYPDAKKPFPEYKEASKRKANHPSFYTLPPNIKEIFEDIANDPEFQYDHHLTDDIDKNIEFIFNHPKLLKTLIAAEIEDYKHDLELEKSWGEDTAYLEQIISDLESLLNKGRLPGQPYTPNLPNMASKRKPVNTLKASLNYLAGNEKEAGALMDRMQQKQQEGMGNMQQLASLLSGAFNKFRSLVFEVKGTDKVIEVAKSGAGLDMKVFEDKDSPTPSSEKKFQMPDFVNYFMQNIAPGNAQQVAQELSSKGLAEVSTNKFASVKASLRSKKAEDLGYPEFKDGGYYNSDGELSDIPMFLVNKTYEKWDEEAVDAGETDDNGFEFEDYAMSPAELAREIEDNNYHWSNSDNTGWLETVDPIYDNDYFEKGIETKYGLHMRKIDGSDLDQEDYAFINGLMRE